MTYWRSDPEVTKWMRTHPDSVERVERIYKGLKDKGFTELLQIAYDVGVDVEKHEEQARSRLISAMVKASAEKVLAILEGQGVLVEGKIGKPNRRDN